MNYSLNVKSSSIVHTLLSNCVKLHFYTVRKNFTGPLVPPVPTNLKSACSWLQEQLDMDITETSKLPLFCGTIRN